MPRTCKTLCGQGHAVDKVGSLGGRENFSPNKGEGEGSFSPHKRGLSLEIHFEGSDLFSERLVEVVLELYLRIQNKSVLVQYWCEALLVALQHSQPKLINSLWVSNFSTDRFIRGMRPLEIAVIFRLQ